MQPKSEFMSCLIGDGSDGTTSKGLQLELAEWDGLLSATFEFRVGDCS